MPVPVFSPEAIQDLDGITADSGSWGKKATTKLLNKLYNRFDLLVLFPDLGTPWSDVRPDLRFSVKHPFVIFYRRWQDTVEIVRVVHGRRDLSSLFPS